MIRLEHVTKTYPTSSRPALDDVSVEIDKGEVVFRNSHAAALTVVLVGGVVNTLFISNYLRPKLAADRSKVLNFYWMFVGLVTGVYTFGLAGILLGPILIGLLKAILDTVTAQASWRILDDDEGDTEAARAS